MSTIQDVSAEQLAKVFHHYREALTHNGEGHGSEEEASSWDRAPQDERKLMVAAARFSVAGVDHDVRATQPAAQVLRYAWRGGVGKLNPPQHDFGRVAGNDLYEFFMNS